jgi:peptidoglycan/xylan/chitin deacetylase (PgdA/CDA1 family)
MKKEMKKRTLTILIVLCVAVAIAACVFLYMQINNMLLEKELTTPQAPVQTEAVGGNISEPATEPTTELPTTQPTTETTTKAPPPATQKPSQPKPSGDNNYSANLAAKIAKLNGKGKKIYLTFDDGPSSLTPKFLDVLDKYNVKATFFVIGKGTIHKYLPMIVERGHTIGLHTYSHNYKYIYASEDNFFKDLDEISKLVEEKTGVVSKVIRFPGGSSNKTSSFNPGIMTKLTGMVQEKGYTYFDWNCTNGDGTSNDLSVNQIINTAVDTALKVSGDLVMLMHDAGAKKTTLEALPKIIEIFRDAGYTFAPIVPETVPVHHTLTN